MCGRFDYIIESKQSQGLDSDNVWSRSGVSEDLFLASDNKSIALAIKYIESSYIDKKGPSPKRR